MFPDYVYRESFALVKGVVLLLEEGEQTGDETAPTLCKPLPSREGQSDDQHRHLHAMVSLLRPEDTLKIVRALTSGSFTPFSVQCFSDNMSL